MSDPTATVVPPWRQAEFKDWLRRNEVTDYLHPQSFYDYGGAFLAGAKREPVTGHWPDTFKLPGHPTFSVESKYAGPGTHPGRWVKGRLVRAAEGP